MGMFFLGILFGFFLEWLFVTFYLKSDTAVAGSNTLTSRLSEEIDEPDSKGHSPTIDMPTGPDPLVRAEELVEDDLTLIPGIGPKKGEALKAVGISTYRDLAAVNKEELREKLTTTGISLQLNGLEQWQKAAASLDH